jgi:hypothetical protein
MDEDSKGKEKRNKKSHSIRLSVYRYVNYEIRHDGPQWYMYVS